MKKIFTLMFALGTLLFANVAHADNDFSAHVETGATIPLTTPQSSIYNPGPSLTVKGLFALTPNWALGPAVSAVYLPRTDTAKNAGLLWQVGPSLRFQGDRRPIHQKYLYDLCPWLDLDVAMGVTGDLILPSVDVGAGLEAPLEKTHTFWMGPFVRYSHMFQTADNHDGHLLNQNDVNLFTAGVSFSFDAPPKTHKVVVEKTVVTKEVIFTPGKTEIKEVVVHDPVVIDFTEKVYFDLDSATLRWESKDKLDVIVKKLNMFPSLKIKVAGSASKDGQLKHNINLAMKRTQAVVKYLSSHGVDASRLVPENWGVSHPTAPNTSKEGKERNRRVEFTVNFTSK